MSRQILIVISGVVIVVSILLLNHLGVFDSENTGMIDKASPQKTIAEENTIEESTTLSADEPDNLSPKYLAYISQLEAGDDIRRLVKDAANLNDEDKQIKVDEINKQISELEKAEKISKVEHLMLQLALVKLSAENEEQAKQKSQHLITQFQQLSAERTQAYINNPSPKFKDYKSREKTIVAEVMAMEVFPDGLTREEYLAQRLAEARQASYQ